MFLHEAINFKLVITFSSKQCWILWQVIVNITAIICHSRQSEINNSYLQNNIKLLAKYHTMSHEQQAWKNKCPAKICYAVYLDITHYYFMQPSHFLSIFLTDLQTFMGIFSQSLEMYFMQMNKILFVDPGNQSSLILLVQKR